MTNYMEMDVRRNVQGTGISVSRNDNGLLSFYDRSGKEITLHRAYVATVDRTVADPCLRADLKRIAAVNVPQNRHRYAADL